MDFETYVLEARVDLDARIQSGGMPASGTGTATRCVSPKKSLVILSKPLCQVVETDKRTPQMEERLVDVVPPLVADR